MRNHLVTSKQPLLNIDGTLREPGWSTSLVQTYNRRDIKKRVTRIKEWDYYSVISNKNNIAVCFTVSDLGYIELDSVSFIDFPYRASILKAIFCHFRWVGFICQAILQSAM